MVAILQDIRSLHNVGSIFRTADAAGVEKLYLCGITPAPLDRFGEVRPPVAKVSLGAEKTVPWEKCGSIEECIQKLKKSGYKIIAIEQHPNSVPYNSLFAAPNSPQKIALVLGAEVKGLPEEILNLADVITEIPMRGKKESLNVGVAFGVIAFKIMERS